MNKLIVALVFGVLVLGTRNNKCFTEQRNEWQNLWNIWLIVINYKGKSSFNYVFTPQQKLNFFALVIHIHCTRQYTYLWIIRKKINCFKNGIGIAPQAAKLLCVLKTPPFCKRVKYETSFRPGSKLERVPPPKNWKSKCVFRWLIGIIQHFEPMLLLLFCFLVYI